MTDNFTAKFELLKRSEVMSALGYTSVAGFNYFLSKNKDFPKPIKNNTGFTARVHFNKAAVLSWLNAHRA